MIFSSAYLPPIEFFIYASRFDKIYIEACENFVKQTYRNRCCIYSANGKLDLIITLEHCRKNRLPLKDVKISYTMPWQKMHWRAIESAYNKSPFFLYYQDYFEKYYTTKFRWLLDFNNELMQECFRLLKLYVCTIETSTYKKDYPQETDMRYAINPREKTAMHFKEYSQVFTYKCGFIPNLSIVDLLFNKGPESKDYLRSINLDIQSGHGAY